MSVVAKVLFVSPIQLLGRNHLLIKFVRTLFSGGKSGWGVKLTTDFHLLPTSRVNGTAPLRPVYAFMALMGKNFTVYFILPHLFYDIFYLLTNSFFLTSKDFRNQ